MNSGIKPTLKKKPSTENEYLNKTDANFCGSLIVKDTQREKAPSIKTHEAYGKYEHGHEYCMNIFKTGSYNKTKFSKKLSDYWQNSVLCDWSILYSPLACDWSILYSPLS